MIDQILNNEFIIEQLMESKTGEKLQTAFYTIEKIQKNLAAITEKQDEKKLTEIKVATIATFAILRKMLDGRKVSAFSDSDWKEIANVISEYAIIQSNREYSVFIFGMYEKYIRNSVKIIRDLAPSETCDVIDALADELNDMEGRFCDGIIGEAEYTEECLWISLEAMFKLLSATKFSIIKNEMLLDFSTALSDFAFEYGRLMLCKREQALITELIESQYKLDEDLKEKYECYVDDLNKQTKQFNEMVDKAFLPDFKEAFLKSIILAQAVGIEESNILKSSEDIDAFFLD